MVKKKINTNEGDQALHVSNSIVKHEFDLNESPVMTEEEEADNVEICQQSHVNHFKVYHDFDLNKLPETMKEIDTTEFAQHVRIGNCNGKYELDLNKLPNDDPDLPPEFQQVIKDMLKILLPKYFKI